MPLWNLGMSLGQFVMAGAWLIAADLPGRVKSLVRQPFFWLVSGLFFLHLLGLWNTEDFTYGMKDIRVKLPLLLMALMFAGGPVLTEKEYRSVFFALLTGVLISTGYGFATFAGWTHLPVNDYRDYSHFISHIRLSLLIDCCITWIILKGVLESPLPNRILSILLILWLAGYLLLIQSVTGLLILFLLGLIFFIIRALEIRTPVRMVLAVMALMVTIVAGGKVYHYIFVESIRYVPYHPYAAGHKTARGGTYNSKVTRQDLEEGRLVWENYCDGEMNEAWQQRTGKNIWQSDQRGQMYQVSLLRYLTSLNLSKDYNGVMQLTDTDIQNILSGHPTPHHSHLRSNPLQRLDDLASEYRSWYYTGWANGQSMVQRFEYLKAGKYILEQHLLTGVGTGDLPKAYDQAYRELNSSLTPEWRLRAHNQYLSFGVAFGLPGMIYFIFVMAWLLVSAWKRKQLLLFAFLWIAAISFLNEDTLETQAGVTFFAFTLGWLWFETPKAEAV
ncbi:MAG: O-antigen ligase family protein [Bacteroidia bacterium]